jgi:hypothetical protein
MIISQSLKIIAFQLSLFKDCPLYNKQKNTWVLGNIMFNTLYLLTTLNISIQTIDCNNLQNSYVLRILCFWGEGDWLGVGRGV